MKRESDLFTKGENGWYMNRQEKDVLLALLREPFTNQRILSEACGHSLGTINRSIKNLIQEGYLDNSVRLTDMSKRELQDKAPKNAIILAAGYGMRMVPINTQSPKALIEIRGEVLIERTIRFLHEVGIGEIYVVVGYMKEQFEYLIDEFGVELIVNEAYTTKNNIHSMKLILKYLSNSYVIPCDIWYNRNPFRKNELYSWYMVSDITDNNSNIRVNRKMELVPINNSGSGNAMVGVSYLTEETACIVRNKIQNLCANRKYDSAFWEEALYEKGRMIVQARVVHAPDAVEINTYEQLRELDENSESLNSDAISVISETLNVRSEEITNIEVLKKGMTNRSFMFKVQGKKYIMRIPGEGTDRLINRNGEAAVYHEINGEGICDENIYINPDNGYKITAYIEKSRVCNPLNERDVIKCMEKLRNFHNREFLVSHEFCLWEQIKFYETLWEGNKSAYRDYEETKRKVFSLKKYVDAHVEKKILTHIDAVPDNFLFAQDEEGKEKIYLIDWEYAGMQDPHIDIAMFGIYSFYDRDQMDNLIQIYFKGACPDNVKIKIYCYIAACGLLWSNWCEYKWKLGIDFGEYSLRQYRYAKEYYRIVCDELGGETVKWGIK